MLGKDYVAQTGYTVGFEVLEQIAPEEMERVKKKGQEILSFVATTYDVTFTMQDIYTLIVADDLWESNIAMYLERTDSNFYETICRDLVNDFQLALHTFKKKTNIDIKCEINYETHEPYLRLNYFDVVQLTPAAVELKDKGIALYLDSWVEIY